MGAPLLVVTPWYPASGSGAPLDAAVAHGVLAAAHAGADVTVVHLSGDPPGPAGGPDGVTVRRLRVEGIDPRVPDPAGVAAVTRALADQAADLLGGAAVVHAHGGLPVAAALASLLGDGVRLVVSEHLASLRALLADGPPAPGLAGAYEPVLARAEVVLVPSDDLGRRLRRRLGGDNASAARIEVLPYLAPEGARRATDADTGALPATRWLVLGRPGSAEPVVRALAADALAGAPTTLTVVDEVAGEAVDEAGSALTSLADRLGAGDRVQTCPSADLVDRLAGGTAFDLVVDLDPLAAAEPALPVAFAAGLPAVLAREAGPEEVLDEVAATGAVRLLRPGAAGVIAVLEAVADLRRAALEPAGPPRTALPVWRTSLAEGGRLLARHYGEALGATGATPGRRPWPRVLFVDLSDADRTTLGRLARWVTGVGGEAVVVTAAAPPPCAAVPGALTVDLRPLERALARPPLAGVRRRLPGAARPALDRAIGAYRFVRGAPTLARAALEGPLAPGSGPDPRFDAVVAADAGGAQLARSWTGTAEVLPPDGDALVRHLSSLGPASPGGTETS